MQQVQQYVPGFGTSTFTYDIIDQAKGVESGEYGKESKDPKENITLKIFDKAGRLKKVKADNESSFTVYQYDITGNRTSITYPEGSKEEYTYYSDNLLKTLTNKKASGEVIGTYEYWYDAAHNQNSKKDKKGVTNYFYDSLNRLEVTVEPSGKTTEYTFDEAGNRLTEKITVNGQTTYTGTTDDPLSLNLYSYCSNEPMMYSDPDGHNLLGVFTLLNGALMNKISCEPKKAVFIEDVHKAVGVFNNIVKAVVVKPVIKVEQKPKIIIKKTTPIKLDIYSLPSKANPITVAAKICWSIVTTPIVCNNSREQRLLEQGVDPSKLSDVWKLKATERGEVIEEILASTEYKEWYNIGSSRGGYFPVIDFQKGNKVVSLKTIDPTLSSMRGNGATNTVIHYLDDLDRKITVNGKLANKTLDGRIPASYLIVEK